MTKILRNVLIGFCGMFAFLFAGFFFAGCGIDYSKIQLSCDKQVVELEVGESVDLTFTIENYQSGFSNKIDFNDQSSGLSKLFSCSDPKYVDENHIKVSVTGLAGGNGKLEVVTLEAGKTCSVDIFVEQYTNDLSDNGQVLYVSNQTSFVPSASFYNFDANTTNKNLSYYYITETRDVDFNLFKLQELSFQGGSYAVFTDGVATVTLPVSRFDKAELLKQLDQQENVLSVSLDGQQVLTGKLSEFNFLAVYDYSINEDGKVKESLYENILYDVSKVYVLPDLEVEISGGYLDSQTGAIEFSDFSENSIRIVPNNSEMNVYILKLEMAMGIEDLAFDFDLSVSNNYVDVDFLKDSNNDGIYDGYYAKNGDEYNVLEKKDNVYYLKITQNSQTQAHTDVSLRVYYDKAQGVYDESVNVEKYFGVDIEIAPVGLLVNGSANPPTKTLYNFYKFPEYGWNELLFDVISGLESTPNFDGLYFVFDESSLEVMCDGINVASDPNGEGKLYTDLNKSFYVRGAYGCETTEVDQPVKLKVCLKSDILQNNATEISVEMSFNIVAGAQILTKSQDYLNTSTFYLDLNSGEKNLADEETKTGVLVADAEFQYITYYLEGGVDVVDIVCDTTKPYIKADNDELYYLNVKIVPKAEGVGLYTIHLDNGMYVQISFSVLKTLNTDDNPFALANSGNNAVTDFRYVKGDFEDGTSIDNIDYDNILYIDILNQSKDGKVEYGSSAVLNLVANTTQQVKFEVLQGSINRFVGDKSYYFTTSDSGLIIINAVVSGDAVGDKFDKQTKTAKYELRISSYSLLQEFYLTNNGDIALSSTVYYGQKKGDSEKSVSFDSYVDNKNAFGFYKYDLTDAGIINAYENSEDYDATENYSYTAESGDFDFVMTSDFYSDKFVYFRLQDGDEVLQTSVTVTIQKSGAKSKTITITNPEGWMFYGYNRQIKTTDEDGREVSYYISFDAEESKKFYTNLGSFNVDTMTYETIYENNYSLRLLAYVSQRSSRKPYEVRIVSQKYQSIESISLGAGLNKLDFSSESDNLVHELSVYTYPLTSTSKKITAIFVPSKDNPYDKMVKIIKDDSNKSNGIFSVTLSCEDFFNIPSLRNNKDIVEIEDNLSGKVYIFPSEWGNSVSEIDSKNTPKVIDVQFRNGSKQNPYLIESVADLKKINSNETTLKSHYELNTVLDMSNETDFIPIGILNGEVVGFSGSIVGANSQAAISNILIKNNNFVFAQTQQDKTVLYGGLFAQLNEQAFIQNVSFSGSFDLKSQNEAYIGLLSSVNKGTISNVATTIEKSNIVQSNENLYFGAVSAINVGTIEQNFNLYDKSFDYKYANENEQMEGYVGYTYKMTVDKSSYVYDSETGEKIKVDGDKLLPKVRDLTGQQAKILAYYNDFVTINTNNASIFAGGIVGASSGTIERIWSSNSELVLYGYSQYSAYSKIKVVGETNKDVYVGGVVAVDSFNTLGANATSTKIPVEDVSENNYLKNLLVGGEVDTSEVVFSDSAKDHIGGFVGFVDTVNNAVIIIANNTVQTFVRGQHDVAGLVGFEYYDTGYGTDKLVSYVNNKLEAIDDGRNKFFASMIIKIVPFGMDYSGTEITETSPEIFIGYFGDPQNSGNTKRDYGSVKIATATTYLERTITELNKADVIYSNLASTTEYYGDYLVLNKTASGFEFTSYCYQVKFEQGTANIGIDTDANTYKMTSDKSEANVYFMYYFAVDGYLSNDQTVNQEEISALNIIKPGSVFYPYKLTTQDVTISTTDTHILSIDLNGVITVNSVGLATLEITSLKNNNKSQKVYIYVVNYFNKDIKTSIFYSQKSSDSINLTDGSLSVVYGNSKSNIYLVADYLSESKNSAVDEDFSISANGILNYNNVDYVLSKNNQMTVLAEKIYKTDESGKVVFEEDENGNQIPVLNEEYFSRVEIINQTIKFSKTSEATDGDLDKYILTPMLYISMQIDGKPYEFVYELDDDCAINLNVEYRERATRISTDSNYTALKTNESFSDLVTIESVNKNEFLYYQIFFDGQLIQDRLPQSTSENTKEEEWKEYVATFAENANGKNFFNIKIGDNQDNTFKFDCSVNKDSDRFASRFEQEIYGEYTIYFYSSDLGLDGGVSYAYKVDLSEAEVNYVKMKNYDDINDLTVESDRLVPNQVGLLEITIDPIEAVFDEIIVSNSQLNYQSGATEAYLTFAYEKVSGKGIEYVLDAEVGKFKDGQWKISYLDLIDFIEKTNEEGKAKNNDEKFSVSYTGKVFVSYLMPSVNVSDMTSVGFDVVVYYSDSQKSDSVEMTTKLGNYAKLSFDDKQDMGGVYYVARGLSYDLTLESFGFDESEITISSSNSAMAEIEGSNGRYTLNITSNSIPYNEDIGYKIEIVTLAKKIVDDVAIITRDTLEIYIMEYTLNYSYAEGVNEDIVKGMQGGVISTAVGNPFRLEFDIYAFLEYDKNNSVVVSEVTEFVNQMTSQIDWKVYYDNTETTLQAGKEVFKTDYYSIDGLVVTPLKTYSYLSNVYHFSMNAYYNMKQGRYSFSAVSTSNKIYTEFVFDVHDQSTQDSPLPIYTYEEFMAMAADEWYILLNDITIPSSETLTSGQTEFKPISNEIAGLDGNGYKIVLGGTYNFSDLSSVGVFEEVSEDTVLKNIIVQLSHDTIFKMDTTFEIGLLAASNKGKISNCEVQQVNGSTLSVVSSASVEACYVAGLVANNSGYITHSRSLINLYTNANLSGFVCKNDTKGVIASSYFKGGNLKNETNTAEITAGFVLENKGRINTSYVSGDAWATVNSSTTVNTNLILSSYNISGFVYTNTGSIWDCYSNIMLEQSGAFAAGFVYENGSGGTIERCYSTSIFENEQSSNYGFARTNYIGAAEGTNQDAGVIKSCFFLQDSSLGVNTSIGEIIVEDGDTNVDLKALTYKEFGIYEYKEEVEGGKTEKRQTDYLEQYFSDYVYAEGRDISAVWFYNDDESNAENFGGQIFNTGKLELVAPNLLATSERQLDHIESVTENGVTFNKYVYVYKSDSAALGSVENPILISSAEEMETYILQENNTAENNFGYYRLISDIDYSDYIYNSKLYSTKFLGYLEGNFMTISDMSFVVSETRTYAGLFAEIGNSSIHNSVGTVMNLNLQPMALSFSNCAAVGALAGKLDGGTIYNVNILTKDDEQSIIVGKNIVGGAIGVTAGDFKIKNLISQISAKARNQSILNENVYNSLSTGYSANSFAGSVVGVLSGIGTFEAGRINGYPLAVIGGKAGLMFGFVDTNVTVTDVEIVMNEEMILNSFGYSGFVVGESKGVLENITVVGTGEYFENFKIIPSKAKAIGGIAGLVSGGRLENIKMSQSIKAGASNQTSGIEYVGGIVGDLSSNAEIINVDVDADLTGFQYVGGIAGRISTNGNINFTDIKNVDGVLRVESTEVGIVGIGGVVGHVDANAKVIVKKESIEKNTINVAVGTNLTIYNQIYLLYVGPVVGHNESNVSHLVEDTEMTIVNSGSGCVAYDYGSDYEKIQATIQVSKEKDASGTEYNAIKVGLPKVNGDDYKILEYVHSDASGENGSTVYCDIKFDTMQGNTVNVLRIELFGELKTLE